jgi:tol-pal system protein YbgF
MKNRLTFSLLVVVVVVAFWVPAQAANKEMVQLQTQVQALQDQMARMQQAFDERMGVMRNLIEQSTDNVNKMSAGVNMLQQTLQKQNSDTGSRVDQVSAQIQALNDSVDELKARMVKVSKQMEEMASARENIPSQAVVPGAIASPQPPPPQAPPPDVLYNNALRDYNAGKYDLATQEFADYIKFYSNTDLAGNSQFYLADIEYRQGNFEAAVRDYDRVLEQYPGGNKTAAAQLKKGFALLELGNRDAGTRELNNLIARYPRSLEATQARDRLRRLGPAATSRPPTRR